MFDVADHLDGLRSWPTERLVARRDKLVRVQREARVEELAVVRVLDERGQIDPTVGGAGESARMVRDTLETARALESLPAVAAAAHAGDLSAEQLGSVVKLADEDSDAEWASAGTARGAGRSGAPGPHEVEAVDRGLAAAPSGAESTDVVGKRPRDAARAGRVAGSVGREVRSNDQSDDRTDAPGEGSTVAALGTTRCRCTR